MVQEEIFSFLSDLKDNNNRDWFSNNKERYEKINKEVKVFFNTIGNELNKIDSIENTQIFRIYRDVRFSKDKLPYKINFGVGYRRTKPMLRGGYYLHLEDGASFIGGGFWEPNTEDLLRIRKEIELDASDLKKIIIDESFIKYFGTLQGDELKTAPRDFDKNHPEIHLIRKKQFLVTRKFTNNEVLDSSFKDEIIATFKAMRPFFDYMSEVLTTNLNGESIY
ncbi:conserved hypothetical protein [Flavobacterium sp. 9AF]|uniref:DUF2461 domain-containing protein n=1 Tax=Flavobacterium sp. 9AF TaxID=2653142 RepID=UPI0012EF5D75|nr:DUF2461 domain-containing protein [Flavobacterium sp. 9AF]VXC03925.1 conserved hypothetical protein [Flavobacterium sp. 9AF]